MSRKSTEARFPKAGLASVIDRLASALRPLSPVSDAALDALARVTTPRVFEPLAWVLRGGRSGACP